MVYSSHTKHSNYMSSVSCSLAPAQEICLITQSASDPPHTANPPLTFSVHMLTAGLRTTQKIGTGGKPRATQTPHTTGTLPLLTWLFLPSKDLPRRGPGGNWVGCKVACFGWNTHPPSTAVSQPGSRFSRRIRTLLPQRCLFMCRARWSDLEKHLSQWEHLKGLAPVCFLKCLVNSSLLAKRHSHPSQEHL